MKRDASYHPSLGIHIKANHEGLLHKKLGIKKSKKIPSKDLEIKPGDSAKTKKQKVFAKNARKWAKK